MYENQGYAIIEYNDRENAERAIAEADGTTFLEQTIHVCVFSVSVLYMTCAD